MEIIATDRLKAEDVRERIERLLPEQFSLQVEGYKITTRISSPPTVNGGKSALTPTRAMSRCGSSIWL